jgi:Transposase.
MSNRSYTPPVGVTRCEVHRLLRSFEHAVRKPVYPMRHLIEVQFARAVTLFKEGWTFRCLSVDLNVSPSVIYYEETGQFIRSFGQGLGCMKTLQDDRYLSMCALRRRSATARELQQDLRRVTGVTMSDQIIRNRLREVSLRARHPVQVPCLS